MGLCGLILWYELVAELVGDLLAGAQPSGFEAVFVDFDALVNVGLTMADETVNECCQSAGKTKTATLAPLRRAMRR